MSKKKLYFIDCETYGLWGDVFAIGVVDEKGNKFGWYVKSFNLVFGLSSDGDFYKNINFPAVISDVNDMKSQDDEIQVLTEFAKFWKENKEYALLVCHCGYAIENRLFAELKKLDLIGAWDAPLYIHDIAQDLAARGLDPSSQDAFLKSNGVSLDGYIEHNPIHDAVNTRLAYKLLHDVVTGCLHLNQSTQPPKEA